MLKITLPPRFAQDRMDRELSCGEGRFTSRGYETVLNDEELEDLISDAEYYTDAWGPDDCPSGIKVSARAALRAIQKARDETTETA